MTKKVINKKTIILAAILLVIAVAVVFFVFTPAISKTNVTSKSTSTKNESLKNIFSYKGEKGKNALELLKKYATVKQDNTGMVISINGRQVNKGKHEYWEFFVNGKSANVGPADYMTKNTDTLMWKIATY